MECVMLGSATVQKITERRENPFLQLLEKRCSSSIEKWLVGR